MKGLLTLSLFAAGAAARAVGVASPQEWIMPYKREALQSIVSLSLLFYEVSMQVRGDNEVKGAR
jgi:hypothetical protein